MRRFLGVAVCFLPLFLCAHGVEVSQAVLNAEQLKTVRFGYSTGEAMAYAKVKLYPPSNPTVETMKSLTDRNGYFAFVADETGEWRVEAEDGMGHKGVISLALGAPASAPTQNSDTKASAAFRIVLALSLIWNISALYVFMRNRRVERKNEVI